MATCKPTIRRVAQTGDWIVGTASKTVSEEARLVFAMEVTEIVSYNEYWEDERFRQKRPNLRGSRKQAFGDNIYHRRRGRSEWIQEDSHHSLPDGRPNPDNIAHDTTAPRVLLSTRFKYWGGEGPLIPKRFRDFEGYDICARHGHKSLFPDRFVSEFLDWLQGLPGNGYQGDPSKWEAEEEDEVL